MVDGVAGWMALALLLAVVVPLFKPELAATLSQHMEGLTVWEMISSRVKTVTPRPALVRVF